MVILLLAVASTSPSHLWVRPLSVEFPSYREARVVEYRNIRPDDDFDEAIVSWNVANAKGAAIDLEVRAHTGDRATKWYSLGHWTYDLIRGPRESVDGQGDSDGNVLTDTLRLRKPAKTLDIRLTLRTVAPGPSPRLKFLSVATSLGKSSPNDVAAPSPAWGRTIPVFKRYQGRYLRGGVLCSATSSSMLLNFWSERLQRPRLDEDVPFVMSGVWDSVYHGAGNWPFNMAYIGATDGLSAFVARLNSISELEKWTVAGIPLACSVSYDLLRGRPLSATEQGHLVVLVGFSKEGDPIFNDPAQSTEITTVYKRADFERAWMYSKRTVYAVLESGSKPPFVP